jgi:hypothetical protein
MPELSSHDWHVQPSCQRTESPMPPKRRAFQSSADSHKCESACPRNSFKLPVSQGCCQPIVPTGFPPVLHSRGAAQNVPNQDLVLELLARNETQSSARNFSGPIGTSQGGSWQLEKRSLGGSCEKTLKPFEEPCPRMRTPWPGQFQVFTCVYFDAGSATRVAQYYIRLATHCSRLIVYTR